MNDITKYQPRLPVAMQRHLDQQSSNMNYIAKLTTEALGEQSHIYSYVMFEVMRTISTIEMLKKAFPKNAMTPETEAALQMLTQDYLRSMEQIPQQACRMILQVLVEAPPPPSDGGLLGGLIDALIGRMNE
jgi:hypothetical protein